MSVLATDNFNRADGGLGANWATQTGNGAPQIGSNKARTNAVGTDSVARYSAISWPNDQYAKQKTITLGASHGNGPCTRCASAANTYYGSYVDGAYGAGASFTTFKCIAGTHSNLATGTKLVATGDVIELRAVGTAISGYINSVLQLGPTTDSAISAGDAGILVFVDSGTTADSEADDWEGGDFGAGGAAVGSYYYRQVAGVGT